ncbi:exonuclease [Leptodontidium sp. MPI-SDFR-AT-0119]|nr:exonuclease [Leptodontidium sp. MPI-SDFR-AT-0119]
MATRVDRDMLALIDSLQTSNLNDTLTTGFIDTHAAMAFLVEALAKLPTSPPSLYLDLEGVALSRHGSVSILQVHVSPKDRTFLIDIHSLGETAFSTTGTSGQTLKGILESNIIPKVYFDVRNDSDALFSHYGIKLACVHDLQLMELATRSFSRRCVNGLTKYIKRDINLSLSERKVWKETKEKGLDLFAPERGGNYEVFNVRPLHEDVLSYCIQDVHFMPKLWRHYNSKLTVA